MERQKLLNVPEKERAWNDRKYYQKNQTIDMIDINFLNIGPVPEITQAASWTGCSTNQIQLLITVITVALSVQG